MKRIAILLVSAMLLAGIAGAQENAPREKARTGSDTTSASSSTAACTGR